MNFSGEFLPNRNHEFYRGTRKFNQYTLAIMHGEPGLEVSVTDNEGCTDNYEISFEELAAIVAHQRSSAMFDISDELAATVTEEWTYIHSSESTILVPNAVLIEFMAMLSANES